MDLHVSGYRTTRVYLCRMLCSSESAFTNTLCIEYAPYSYIYILAFTDLLELAAEIILPTHNVRRRT